MVLSTRARPHVPSGRVFQTPLLLASLAHVWRRQPRNVENALRLQLVGSVPFLALTPTCSRIPPGLQALSRFSVLLDSRVGCPDLPELSGEYTC